MVTETCMCLAENVDLIQNAATGARYTPFGSSNLLHEHDRGPA